jgi:hypothetical protein
MKEQYWPSVDGVNTLDSFDSRAGWVFTESRDPAKTTRSAQTALISHSAPAGS